MKILIFLLTALLVMSCAAHKAGSSVVEKEILVHLQGKLDKTHLETHYQDHGFIDASLASRTENKWLARFSLKERRVSCLLKKLNEDSEVISAQLQEQELSPPANSTNTGHSKTKKIKLP
jgi:hypothetical protein